MDVPREEYVKSLSSLTDRLFDIFSFLNEKELQQTTQVSISFAEHFAKHKNAYLKNLRERLYNQIETLHVSDEDKTYLQNQKYLTFFDIHLGNQICKPDFTTNSNGTKTYNLNNKFNVNNKFTGIFVLAQVKFIILYNSDWSSYHLMKICVLCVCFFNFFR